MIRQELNQFTAWIYSHIGYQLFITPVRMKPGSHYHTFMHQAQEWFYSHRDERIVRNSPKSHVVHVFNAGQQKNPRKVLITHGWMSCSTWMSKLIHDFLAAGFDVYALDFPAHGEAKGLQITWEDAVRVITSTLNNFGPFELAVGHSFGGSMLINVVNLSAQVSEFKVDTLPLDIVTMGSPTRMRTPVYQLAKRLRLSGSEYKTLRETIMKRTTTDPRRLRLRNLVQQNSAVNWLCIHGLEDAVIDPYESRIFCECVPNSHLALFSDMDHLTMLNDGRISETILDFIGSW